MKEHATPREWWLIEDKKILASNRMHRVLDEEQVRDYQHGWDGPFAKKSDFIHVREVRPDDEVITRRQLREALMAAWNECEIGSRWPVASVYHRVLRHLFPEGDK